MNRFYELASGGALETFADDERGQALSRARELAAKRPIRVVLRHIEVRGRSRTSVVVFDSDAPKTPLQPPVRERLSQLAQPSN